MMEWMMWLSAQSFATVLLAKATLLLGIALLLTLTLRRASAAVRHAICALAVVSVMLLPVLMRALPSWSVPLFPAPVLDATSSLATPVEFTPPVSAVLSSAASIERERFPLIPFLWIAGTLAVVAWLAAGRIALWRIRQRSVAAPAEWQQALRTRAATMGVERDVRLLMSADVTAPLTWGARTAVIMLPAEAAEWNAERRRVVLDHELAHVLRRDAFTQLMAGLACALYWFHPGVWWISRRLRIERERACDDVVLAGGISGADYAEHLLDVARSAHALPSRMVSIAMAGRSDLEGRLISVLDDDRMRRPSRFSVRRAALPALLVVGAVAVFRPVAAASSLLPTGVKNTVEDPVVTTLTSVTPQPVVQAADTTMRVRANRGDILYITLNTGGSIDVTGVDSDQVTVTAALKGAETAVRLEKNGDAVQLHAAARADSAVSQTDHAFTITVPRQFRLRIESAGGSVRIENVDGNITGHTGGGAIRVSHTRGLMSLSTGGGSIEVRDSELSGTVSTGGGDVRIINVHGGLRGSTGSGNVYEGEDGNSTSYGNHMGARRLVESYNRVNRSSLRAPGDTAAIRPVFQLQAANEALFEARQREQRDALYENAEKAPFIVDKAGGAITLDRLLAGGRLTTGGGDITLGEIGGITFARTGGGNITIRSAQGAVEAHTGAGDVEITVPSGGQPVDISITTGKGRVIVNLPADVSAVLDLDAAYTRSADPTDITSDFDVAVSRPDDWDRSVGSPRRHVRGTATLGSGAGRIRVRAVNGDIVIRRR